MPGIFEQPENNVISVTQQLLKLLKVKVSTSTIKDTIEEHTDYPSLLSVADTLQTWGIETAGVKITYDQFITLPFPALVHFKNNQLFLVTEVNDSSIMYLNEKNRKAQFSKNEFIEKWDGIV